MSCFIERVLPATMLTLAIPRPRWAMCGPAVTLPWDYPLEAIADYLTGSAIHTLAKVILIAAALGYAATGKRGEGVRYLFRVGIGLTIALNAASIMKFLFG
jgi:type IV secretory pathway VirB2 component (pilin)